LSINEAVNYGIKFHQAGDIDMAEKIYNEILIHVPNHIDILHLKGVIANQRGNFKEAARLINQAIKLIPDASKDNPAFSSFYQNIANAYFQDDDIENAKGAYKQALSLQPNNVDARFNYSKLLKDTRQYQQAIDELDTILTLMPTYTNVFAEKAKIYFELKRFDDAKSFFEKKLAVDSFDYEANMGLAKCHLELKEYESAKDILEKCTKLGHSLYEPYFWLANLHSSTGMASEAIVSYQRCLEKKPDFVPALINLANIYKTQKQTQKAAELLTQAVSIEPENYEVNFSLGATYVDQNKLDSAVEYFSKANKIKPSTQGSLALAKTLERCGKRAEAKAIFESICDTDAQNLEALSHLIALKMDIFDHEGLGELKDRLLVLAQTCGGEGLNPFDICTKFQFIPPIQRKEYLQNYCEKAFGGLQQEYAGRYDFSKRAKSERLKIGFLSSDYKDQATMHLACGMFEYFDRDNFEVYALALGYDKNSYYYTRVFENVEHFVDLTNISYIEVADKIYALGIDILIDLNSHSNGSMMETLSIRPAPTQITYLYHPSTSGAKFMDYCLVDDIVAPFGDSDLFTEKLLYLPDCYQVNDAKQPISQRIFSKTELGFNEEDFIFCCFNAAWKIEDDIFAVWMRLLSKVPHSKLWLLRFNDEACVNIKKRAIALGVDESRIVFADNMTKDEHLARLKIADLFLDTRPYNAHTTASDALYVGIPLITMKGDSFASRVAESLLANVALEKLAAKNLVEYEEEVLKLAISKDKIAELKSFLSQTARNSKLFDTNRFVNNLESILKKI